MEAETQNQQSNTEADDVISWFDGVAETAGTVQRETLRQILELNDGVEYLKPWLGDVKIRDLDDAELESLYRKTVPIANHSDFEPYIQRIADGDTSPLLTRCPVNALSRTSGTTEGRYKYVPFTNHYARLAFQISSLADAITLRAFPRGNEGKILGFIHCYKHYETKGGLKVGAVTSHFFSTEAFKDRQQNSKSSLCSPVDVIFGEDYKQSTYCHLLLGLFFSDQVKTVFSIFAYAIVQAFNEFEDLWRELCGDIREGRLSPRIICPKLRKAVLDIISPSPSLASRIEASCDVLEGLDWFGVMAILWPNAVYVGCVVTGSMQPYVKKLKHYAGDLPVVGSGYASSETFVGVNLEPTSPPEDVTFTVVPTATYFEFIPLKQDRNLSGDDFKEPDPIRLSEVEAGQEYEIILTTFNGLYRYRLGDIVEVVGFYKKTPKLKFIRRGKIILSITVEKTSEKDLEPVIEKASEMLGKSNAEIVDFTTHADVAVQPGHYVIYLEIKGEAEDRILRECCTEMDASFLQMAYVTSRKFKSIGPLELCILEKGTFKKIMDCFVRNGGTLSQFKTPRSTNNQAFLDILNSCTLERFRSTAYE